MSHYPTAHAGKAKSRMHGMAGLLAFVASPVFAIMAWIAANGGGAMALCTTVPGMLPVDGMTAMYLLMSIFHLPPWLRIAARRPWSHTWSDIRGDKP